MSDKDITQRNILKKIGVGSAVGSFASMGTVTAAENNPTSKSPPKESQPQIEVLAKNDSQAIFRLKESGVSHLYRDFSGGVHKSNKEEKDKQENSDNGEKSDDNIQKMTKSEQELRKEVSDKEDELLEVNTDTLQVISERTEPTTQGEITSSGAEQSERLANRVSSSGIEPDDEDFQIDGVESTDDVSSSKSKVSATDLDPITEVTFDAITKDYGYYSHQFSECNGLAYDTCNYLGIWVEFSDDVETIALGIVGGVICFIALKKLTIPAKWLGIANVSYGALLAVPTSELVDREYIGGFWDAYGLQQDDEKVKYGYEYSTGKYVLPRAYEDFDIPGVYTEAVDYIQTIAFLQEIVDRAQLLLWDQRGRGHCVNGVRYE